MAATRVLATIAALGLALTGCGGGEPSDTPPTDSPTATDTATPSDTPTATETPTATDTPTTSETDSESEPSALEQPAIWPAASVVFDTPEEAASDFVSHALVDEPSLGEFQQGDARSGEIPVLFAGEGSDGTPIQRGLLLLRQLGPSDGWFVTAAPNDVVTITTPEQAATVDAGTITVAGVARGFEGNVVVSAFPAGDADTVLDQQVTIAGSQADPEPYSVTLDLSGATPGDTVTILVRGGTGHELDPGDFAAIAVVVAG